MGLAVWLAFNSREVSNQNVTASTPQPLWIMALVNELTNALYHARTVIAIGDAKPGITGAQHFHPRLAGHYQIVDKRWECRTRPSRRARSFPRKW